MERATTPDASTKDDLKDILEHAEGDDRLPSRHGSRISITDDVVPHDDDAAQAGRVHSMKGRTISWDMQRINETSELEFKVALSASELDLIGMGLNFLPVASPSKAGEKGRVHRTIKVRVPSLTMPKPPSKRMKLYALLIWLVTSAGAAMVAACAAPLPPRRARQIAALRHSR